MFQFWCVLKDFEESLIILGVFALKAGDCQVLFNRVILSLLYIIIETMRVEDPLDSTHYLEMRATFATELGMPMFNNEPVAIILFNMITKFCNGTAPHFPIKKVLLLLWKTVLVRLYSVYTYCKTSLPIFDRELMGVMAISIYYALPNGPYRVPTSNCK